MDVNLNYNSASNDFGGATIGGSSSSIVDFNGATIGGGGGSNTLTVTDALKNDVDATNVNVAVRSASAVFAPSAFCLTRFRRMTACYWLQHPSTPPGVFLPAGRCPGPSPGPGTDPSPDSGVYHLPLPQALHPAHLPLPQPVPLPQVLSRQLRRQRSQESGTVAIIPTNASAGTIQHHAFKFLPNHPANSDNEELVLFEC